MSDFEERVARAGIPELIGNVLAAFDRLTNEQRASWPETVRYGVERVRSILDLALEITGAVLPVFVIQGQIDALLNPLQEMSSHINAYEADSNQNHLDLITGHLCDQVLIALQSWSVRPPAGEAVDGIAEGFGRAFNVRTEAVQGQLDEAEARILRVETEVKESRDGLESLLAEQRASIQNQVSNQETRIQDLKSAIDAQLPRIDQTVAGMQEEFARAQEARLAYATRQKAELDAFTNAGQAEFEERSKEIIAGIQNALEEAQRQVGIIAVTGTAAAYQVEADAQRGVANIWRIVATITGGVAGIVLIVFLFAKNNETTAQAITHLITGLVVFGFAGYAAQQSGNHRRREEAARKTQLKLISFPPFVGRMKPEDREQAERDLVKTLFTEGPSVVEGEEGLSKAQVSIFGQVADVVLKILKRN